MYESLHNALPCPPTNQADLSQFQVEPAASLSSPDKNGDQDEEAPTEDSLEEFVEHVEHMAESLSIAKEEVPCT